MAGNLIAFAMMALLIAGCAYIFVIHRRLAETDGIVLRSSDIFTRFPTEPASEQELLARKRTIRALRSWFALWLLLAFLLGFIVVPRTSSAETANLPKLASSIHTSIGGFQCQTLI